MRVIGREIGKEQIAVKDYVKLPVYLAQGICYHAAGHVYTPKPKWSTLNITHHCNSRCVMCSEWTRQDNEKELTPDEIVDIYRNPLFRSIRRLGISGGEPTLREDLVDIVGAILDTCPQLQQVIISTNGLDTDTVIDRISELLKVGEQKHLRDFTVALSLDGSGATHEQIRRVPEAFEKVRETINRLKLLQKKAPFYFCLVCVVQPLNLDNLADLAKFSREMELPITFGPVCHSSTFIREDVSKESLRLHEADIERLRMLFNRELQPYVTVSNSIFWREYFAVMSGRKRRLPCPLRNFHAGVDCDGTLYMCNADLSLVYGNLHDEEPDKIWYNEKSREVRKKAERYFCHECTIHCDVAYSLRTEFFYLATLLLKGK